MQRGSLSQLVQQNVGCPCSRPTLGYDAVKRLMRTKLRHVQGLGLRHCEHRSHNTRWSTVITPTSEPRAGKLRPPYDEVER